MICVFLFYTVFMCVYIYDLFFEGEILIRAKGFWEWYFKYDEASNRDNFVGWFFRGNLKYIAIYLYSFYWNLIPYLLDFYLSSFLHSFRFWNTDFDDSVHFSINEFNIDYLIWCNSPHGSSTHYATFWFDYKEILFYEWWNSFLENFSIKQFLHTTPPLFIIGGSFFLTSTLCSLVLMSYLGLCGVFCLNFATIFFFWISTVFSFSDFFSYNYFFKVNFGKWFTVLENVNIFFELYIDSVSYSFMLLTVTIAMFVYIYVFSYFRYDANVERLILLINSFVISMVILVTSGNFFVLFLGWELIGLTSFFLINFWSTRISTVKSAFKAFVFNKFSDVSILIALLLIFNITNDINIVAFNSEIAVYNNHYLNLMGWDIPVVDLISFFFICAAFIKSAQFGAHVWLPDSMEAPVPASALIHSATLVSAGVFLLLRLSPIFEASTFCYWLIPSIGSFTALFGGVCAAKQTDAKRILAYSTISHCGFLMVAYSLHVPEYTVLYLYIHGFFKAAVFLCAGNVIRFSRNYQDHRRMGNYWSFLPFEYFGSMVCLINLCGLPFTLGFYIKHLILIAQDSNAFYISFVVLNVIVGAISGLFYSSNFLYYIFLDAPKGKKAIYAQATRIDLKSWYYSNSTIASMVSITALIIVSYTISGSLMHLFLNKNSIGESLDIHSMYSSLSYEFVLPTKSFLQNVSYINWIILIFIMLISFSTWRMVLNGYYFINLFSLLVLVFISMYVFMFFLF